MADSIQKEGMGPGVVQGELLDDSRHLVLVKTQLGTVYTHQEFKTRSLTPIPFCFGDLDPMKEACLAARRRGSERLEVSPNGRRPAPSGCATPSVWPGGPRSLRPESPPLPPHPAVSSSGLPAECARVGEGGGGGGSKGSRPATLLHWPTPWGLLVGKISTLAAAAATRDTAANVGLPVGR